MSRVIYSVLLSVLLLTQVSCESPISDFPISSLEEAQVDETLIGTWRMTDEYGETHYLHVGRAGDSQRENLMVFTTARFLDEGVLRHTATPFFVTMLEEMKVANVPSFSREPGQELPAEDFENIQGYRFMKYTVDQGELRLFSFDQDAILQALRNGELVGSVITHYNGEGQPVEEVRISTPSEKLQEFLETGGTLFKPEPDETYQRVDD